MSWKFWKKKKRECLDPPNGVWLLMDYVNNKLPRELRKVFEKHVDKCKFCEELLFEKRAESRCVDMNVGIWRILYVMGALENRPKAKAKFEEHIEECPYCRNGLLEDIARHKAFKKMLNDPERQRRISEWAARKADIEVMLEKYDKAISLYKMAVQYDPENEEYKKELELLEYKFPEYDNINKE